MGLCGPTPQKELVEACSGCDGRTDRRAGDNLRACSHATHRPRSGTFFTSRVLVKHMLTTGQRLIGQAPDVVVDPGAGVGAFSLAAASRWPGARVIAVDINLVTLGLLAARLDHAGPADHAELVLGDVVGWLATRTRDPGSVS